MTQSANNVEQKKEGDLQVLRLFSHPPFFVSIAVMLPSCVREIHLEPESSFQAPVRHIPRPGGIKLGSPAPKFAAN